MATNDKTLENIIRSATLIVTCAYQVYTIWTEDKK